MGFGSSSLQNAHWQASVRKYTNDNTVSNEEAELNSQMRAVHREFHVEPIQSYSLTLKNFFGRTLEKVPEKRSTIKELLLDSWIKANPNMT